MVRDGATLEGKPPSTAQPQSGKLEAIGKYHSETGEERNTPEV